MSIKKKFNSFCGASVLEFTIVFAVVMTAAVGMYKYIYRGIAGKWKQAGETFELRQFDPATTDECGFSPYEQVWYDSRCYRDCVAKDLDPRHYDNPEFMDKCCACCCDGDPRPFHIFPARGESRCTEGACDPPPLMESVGPGQEEATGCFCLFL